MTIARDIPFGNPAIVFTVFIGTVVHIRINLPSVFMINGGGSGIALDVVIFSSSHKGQRGLLVGKEDCQP
jgi:hypothetical protein